MQLSVTRRVTHENFTGALSVVRVTLSTLMSQKVFFEAKRTSIGKKEDESDAGTTNSIEPVRLVPSMRSICHSMTDRRESYLKSPSQLLTCAG